MNKTDLLVISYLRSNARETLTNLSKKTQIPISTLFERVRHLRETVISRHTSLLEFEKMGYTIKSHTLIKVKSENREQMKAFLIRSQSVNTVASTNNGYDFIAETVFRSMREQASFNEELSLLNAVNVEEHYVLNDLKKEGFLSDPRMVGLY